MRLIDTGRPGHELPASRGGGASYAPQVNAKGDDDRISAAIQRKVMTLLGGIGWLSMFRSPEVVVV